MFFVTVYASSSHPDFSNRDPESYRESEFDLYDDALAFANKLIDEGIWDVYGPKPPA